MKFNCSHTFTIEAESREDFDEKIRHYSNLLRRASERLDIGYRHGLVFGQIAEVGYVRAIDNDETQEPETLFDD